MGWIRSKVAEFLEIESYRIKLSRGLSLLANDNVKIHDVMDGWKNTQEGNVIEITVMTADETRKTMEKLREVDTIEDFRLLMYPPGLFENLGNEDEVYQTVKEWLREAANESRDHIAVGADHDFSLRYLVPTPVYHALHDMGLSQGWQPECVFAALLSNISFLENPVEPMGP